MQQSAKEKQLFGLIQNVTHHVFADKTEEVLRALKEDDINIAYLDENGMTLLDQACYRGNITLVKELLERGADPNSNKHAHGYTSLMFAAISGKTQGPEICQLLLDAGARSYSTNSINKTASELAAFVGQYECVSVINAYISIDEIDKFLHPQGKNSPEQFPRELCLLLHATTKTHNIHPIKVVLFVAEHEVLMQFRKKYLYVVDRIFERQLRCKQSNEVMSIKLWLLLFILRTTFNVLDSNTDTDKSIKEKLLVYVKYLLKMEPGQILRPNVEILLRNTVKAFPYHQTMIFRMLVKMIAETKEGCEPSVYKCIMQILFGPALVARSVFCACCGVPNALKRCPNCKLAYCGMECQKLDWKIHKKCCASLAISLQEQDEVVVPKTALGEQEVAPVEEVSALNLKNDKLSDVNNSSDLSEITVEMREDLLKNCDSVPDCKASES